MIICYAKRSKEIEAQQIKKLELNVMIIHKTGAVEMSYEENNAFYNFGYMSMFGIQLGRLRKSLRKGKTKGWTEFLACFHASNETIHDQQAKLRRFMMGENARVYVSLGRYTSYASHSVIIVSCECESYACPERGTPKPRAFNAFERDFL